MLQAMEHGIIYTYRTHATWWPDTAEESGHKARKLLLTLKQLFRKSADTGYLKAHQRESIILPTELPSKVRLQLEEPGNYLFTTLPIDFIGSTVPLA